MNLFVKYENKVYENKLCTELFIDNKPKNPD